MPLLAINITLDLPLLLLLIIDTPIFMIFSLAIIFHAISLRLFSSIRHYAIFISHRSLPFILIIASPIAGLSAFRYTAAFLSLHSITFFDYYCLPMPLAIIIDSCLIHFITVAGHCHNITIITPPHYSAYCFHFILPAAEQYPILRH